MVEQVIKHMHNKPEIVQSIKAYTVSGGVLSYTWLVDVVNIAQAIGAIAASLLACFMLYKNVRDYFKK